MTDKVHIPLEPVIIDKVRYGRTACYGNTDRTDQTVISGEMAAAAPLDEILTCGAWRFL